MRKILALIGVIMIAFLSMSFVELNKSIDNDVGYSVIALDQDVTVINNFQVAVVPQIESQTVIERGVSVPDKGLVSTEMILLNNISSFENTDNNSVYDYKAPPRTLDGVNQDIDKYQASDLGNWQSNTKINII